MLRGVTYSVAYTAATTGAYKLSFLDNSANNVGAILDNVSVKAVPEPGELALWATGLGLLGFITKRRAKIA